MNYYGENLEKLSAAFGDLAVISRKAGEIIANLFCQLQKKSESNNWRKMHGLPMRRKINRK